jgi:hypothetical protein
MQVAYSSMVKHFRLRAMQPVNFARLHTELKTGKLMSCNNYIKYIASFPSYVGRFSLENIESLIKFKLRTETTGRCSPVPPELRKKVGSVCLFFTITLKQCETNLSFKKYL